jgi:chromosome segregation ATPase
MGFALAVACASAQVNDETAERVRIAAANMEDAVVVDCQLPGKLRRLGGTRTYLTPGRLIRTSAIVCRTRGGEYTLGDLASGTLSLQRWMIPAENGDAEAQYYVARIHATGMDNVAIDYARAAQWYEKAADQGLSEAKQELGYLYERGLGVAKDPLKALNLQRDASGLGEDLDYAHKIADAEALAESLATQLQAANSALRDSQFALSETQDQLFAAREGVRRQELQMVGLVADLEEARRLAANSPSSKVAELEEDIATATAQLELSQMAMLRLEQERDTAKTELAAQLAGGQATQLELRELLARTERAEGAMETLAAQLAEAQQRLIHSDEEVRELQTAYREQSDLLAGERARLLEARSRSETDAQAYLAAREIEIASKAARIAGLESQIGNLQDLLENAQRTGVEDALRQEFEALRTRYDSDVAALQRDRDRLTQGQAASNEQIASRETRIASLESQILAMQSRLADAQNTDIEDSLRQELEALKVRYDNDMAALQRDRDRLVTAHAASEEQLAQLYAESKQRLAASDSALNSRKREIETLTAESARLRARVEQLEAEQLSAANQSGLSNAQLQARLSMARQQVMTLRSSLDEERTEKASLEAQLLKDRMSLQDQMTSDNAASAQEIALLRTEIELNEKTIEVQTLRIAALEKEARDSGLALNELKDDLGEPAFDAIDIEPAMAVLELAQSEVEPFLGRYHALLIANEDYVNLQDLTTPIRDAIEIEKLLVTRYGFSVKVLRNATDEDIMLTLHEYSNTLTEDDNLLIYYAGRGSTPDGPPDRAYWLGVDANPQLRNTWLLAEHVSDKIKEIEAKRVLLVTDSCFSRRRVQSTTMTVGRGLDPERFKLLAQFRSRYVLTSGANLPVHDESGDRTHSLFAKYFMEVLRQNRNVLSGEMLSHEMINRVREGVAESERATPTYNFLQDAGHIAGDFFFVPLQEPLLVASAPTRRDSV